MLNTRVVLLRHPTDRATPDHFSVETEELGPLEPGQVRVAVEYISIDAGARTMLVGEGFHRQAVLGDIVPSHGVGRVVESGDDNWSVGQAVRGRFGSQTVATVEGSKIEAIDDSIGTMSMHLGVLSGSTGVTAWIGMREVAKPQAGDVFVVSAAAGAVGSIVGQIAKREGARVIGIAGGADKCRYLTEELGFDEAIDYKNDDANTRLRELAPDGVNGFFDNVGGPILDAVLDNLAMRARVTICGAISQYDNMDAVVGPSLYLRLAERQSTMVGFAYFHFADRIPAALEELASWVDDGSISLNETVLDGIERFPEALEVMFTGGNLGKLLVKI
ncbi:MAG: NADP-dependent oxidoreductase [Ilumatobacter sp.]